MVVEARERALYFEDAYRAEAACQIVAHTQEGGAVIDRSLFYPTGAARPATAGC